MDYFWNLKAQLYWKVFGIPPLNEPWRDAQWEGRRRSCQTVKDYQPHSAAQHVRILLHGPPGSGKSSFINSVDSALRGQVSTRALVATAYDGSFTNKYKTYRIEKEGPGSHHALVFCDTMGIERGGGAGAEVHHIKMILEGRVRDGFQFDAGRLQNDRYCNQTPTINDKVHVLVCVVPADKIHMMDMMHFHKIREIRQVARDLGIPQVIVVTKIDQASEVIRYNLRYVYRSSRLKHLMERVSAMVGVPMTCVVPVKNYSTETQTHEDTDTLILNAVTMIIRYGEDFLNDQE